MGYPLGAPQHLLAVALQLAAAGAVGGLAARRWRRVGAAAGALAVLALAWADLAGLIMPSRIAAGLRAALRAEYAAVLGGVLAAGLLLVTLSGRRRGARSRPAA